MLFNKKIKETIRQSEVHNKTPDSLASRCTAVLKQWAERMQAKTEKLSVKVKTIMLLLFCFSASAYSIYLLTDSLLGRHRLSFEITSIKQPGYTSLTGDRSTKNNRGLNEEEYQKIHHLKLYLDSLSNSSSGKGLYDSILKHRPGLMDSFHLIENIYQSQNKN